MSIINLLPNGIKQQRKVDSLNYYTLIGGMIIVMGAVILSGLLFLFDQVYQVNLTNVRTQKTQAEAQAAQYLDVEKKSLALEKQLENLKKAQGQTTNWTSLLTELQRLTPPNLSIDGFTVGSSTDPAAKTLINGKADSRRTLGQFQIALAGSKYVKNVEIETSTLEGSAISYKMVMEISYDKLNGPKK